VSATARVRGKMSALRRRAGGEWTERFEWGLQRLLRDRRADIPLNPYQAAFCEWNAQRLDISIDESKRRFVASLRTLRGGHSGIALRIYNDIAHSLYQVFASDAENEVVSAYELHSPAHFLRTLSQPPPAWADDHPAVRAFARVGPVTILDFGCGMAQPSISLAQRLQAAGAHPDLLLADIPTMRFEFVGWLVKAWGLDAQLFPCTPEEPVPALPECDVLIAREFFEHVYDPVTYMNALDRSVRSGGMLVTNVADHHDEFMHVSPNLAALRARLGELGYEPLIGNRVYRKS
jgi:hypothetical protein